jgi:hypothetical protein
MDLLGLDLDAVRAYVDEDSDTVRERSLHWIHPSCLGRRAAAALDAALQGLQAFSFEGLFLRMIGGSSHSGARYHPSQAPVSYSPFYAIQTTHYDNFPNGKRRSEVLYLSDVVHARASRLSQAQLQPAKAEMQAIFDLLRADTPYTAGRHFQRKGCSALEIAAHITDALDAESKVRLLKRIPMLLNRQSDPLLRSSPGQEAGLTMPPYSRMQPGVASAGVQGSDSHFGATSDSSLLPSFGGTQSLIETLPSLAGVSDDFLQSIHQILDQEFGTGGLAHLAEAVTQASQQAPKGAHCMFAGACISTPFPFTSITTQSQRWNVFPFGAAASLTRLYEGRGIQQGLARRMTQPLQPPLPASLELKWKHKR